jgi:hypothetical protein
LEPRYAEVIRLLFVATAQQSTLSATFFSYGLRLWWVEKLNLYIQYIKKGGDVI